MTTGRLDQTSTIRLDAAGNGTASVGPIGMRETWHPESAHVVVGTDNNEAVCNIYVGDRVMQATFRDATASGSIGDSTDRVTGTVRTPDRVWAVWTGGDPKALATLTVTGTREIQ